MITAIITNVGNSEIAFENTKYFPKKPTNGGTPANDNKANTATNPKTGLRFANPLKASKRSSLSFMMIAIVIKAITENP